MVTVEQQHAIGFLGFSTSFLVLDALRDGVRLKVLDVPSLVDEAQEHVELLPSKKVIE